MGAPSLAVSADIVLVSVCVANFECVQLSQVAESHHKGCKMSHAPENADVEIP